MLRKVTPWLIFLCLAFLGLGATPFAPLADHMAVALRFSVVIFLSILVVPEKFNPRSEPPTGTYGRRGSGKNILRSFTRWCRSEAD